MEKGDKIWEVFIQRRAGASFKHTGSVHAYDKKMAIQNARDLYTRRGEGREIWVVETIHIVSTPLDQADAFFDPSVDKAYRMADFYKIPEGVENM